ncbi:MAG: AsmA family protein, partial [Gammaproteobacteria bacterium]|nr:AsmA family protein [Gammaproteobacteria bacterium]
MSFSLEAGYNDTLLEISGQVGTIDGLLAGEDFPLDISGNLGDLLISMNGNIANLTDIPSGSVTLSLEVDSLSRLNTLAGTDLPDQGPLLFNGILNFTDSNNLRLNEINLQLAELAITGDFAANTAGAVPMITATLESDVLDLSPFMPEEAEEDVEFLFPRDPLPLASLAAVNADLTFNANRIITPSVEVTENELSISLNDGNLRLANGSAIAGGNSSALIQLDTINDSQARLSTDISGDSIMLELLPHEEDRWFTGGATTIAINGTGTGGSVAEIMGSLNGNILIQVGEARMPNSGIDMFGADIILSTFNKLNPLSSQEDFSLLECAVINLPVDDGIIKLDRQIAVQTSKMHMVGSGEINLKNEELNLGVKPYAKEGVGLNLSSIAGAAKIGGTLANPSPEIDAENAIKTGLSAGAAVATGGLSLL